MQPLPALKRPESSQLCTVTGTPTPAGSKPLSLW